MSERPGGWLGYAKGHLRGDGLSLWLLRLGLNQRPSDKQFSGSIVSIDLDMLFTVALALWGASLRFAVLDQ
ncbi:hypothetical protein [Bifidobacterium pullorum]|uniref:hypothetical protein n=1 Tax=Bifidobacterium pullorum TaxID=78448 RepID=UPI00388D04E0